jgi:hypothetical protein
VQCSRVQGLVFGVFDDVTLSKICCSEIIIKINNVCKYRNRIDNNMTYQGDPNNINTVFKL